MTSMIHRSWSYTLVLLVILFLVRSSSSVEEPGIKIVAVHKPEEDDGAGDAEQEKECEAGPVRTFAVFGASGETGQTVVDYLLAQQHKVRIVTRHPEAWEQVKNVQVKAVPDYEDKKAFAKAFANCDGAFISPHLPYKAEDFFAEANRSLHALRWGLEKAKVPKLVIISSIGAHLNPREHKIGSIAASHWMEKEFESFPAPVTFLRAAWILDNYKSLALAVAKKQNVLPSFLMPFDKKREIVSNFDMGVWAGKTLVENWDGVRALEVHGPSPSSPQDVANAVGKALKKKEGIKAVGVPQQHYKDLLKSFLGPSAMDLWIEAINGLNSGVIKFEGGVSKTILGETGLEDIVATWFDDDAQNTESEEIGSQQRPSDGTRIESPP